MLGKPFDHTFIPMDHDVFAGLDVSKKSISVTFSDHHTVLNSLKMPYNPSHLLNYVRRRFPEKNVAFAFEAGCNGYGLYDHITAQGFPCLVVAPALVPTAPGKNVKTDRLDSLKLSLSLRGGSLQSIHVPSIAFRQLRHLVQLRDSYVRQAAAFKCRIKSLLLFEGLPFPETPASSQWSRRVIQELNQLPCIPAVRFKLDQLITSLDFTHKQLLTTTREIRSFCQSDPDIRRNMDLLMTIPGIGRIVASALLARIGDWRHINNVRQISSFFGVVPREHSTGNTVHRGSITRTGDERARSKLIEASWRAIFLDPELKAFYHRIYEKNPRPMAAQKAITAVANKLCKRIACVLKNQRPYVVERAIKPLHRKNEETAISQGTPRESTEPRQPS